MDCEARWRYLWQRAGRQKAVSETDTHTNLSRCLSTLQMTAIGLGSTIGVGIYVLLGVAIRDYAGPGVILSFLVAGLVVLSNAVIYAEFGSYIPHTGAAYTYMYRAVGELAAFLTGWMGLFSLTCSAATGARAWSGFIDSLFNNSIQAYFDDKMGQLDLGPPFARSLDWMAFTFFLVLTLVVSCNVQFSSLVNTILSVLTTAVLVFVTVAGPIVGDIHRLVAPDHGGFLPYGMSGVVAGASAAFFAFNGYDSICISAEEAKDPVKSVPRAIMIELLIVTVVYCGAAVGTVSLIPFNEIDLRAPIPSAFAYQGLTWARYIVTIGPVIAMTNLSLLSLYTQSRIFYRMAQDGLIFKKFAYIHPVTKVPLLGVVVCGILVAVISLLLELKDLVRFSVLCMLFQYIILAPALVNLRATDHQKVTSGDRETRKRTNGTKYSDSSRQLLLLASLENSQSTELDAVAHKSEDSVGNRDGGSLLDDGLSGLTSSHASSTSYTYSYVTAGDLGSGSHTENQHEGGEFLFGARTQPAGNFNQNNSAGILVDVSQGASSEVSQSEDSIFLQRNHDPASSELADESHLSEESSQTRSEVSSFYPNRSGSRVGVRDDGCFENTANEFFRLLTTTRCLVLLVVLLGALAVQLGLGWKDIRRASAVAVLSTLLLLMLIIFLCEVIRKRCGPGHHEGFKVPLVPYVPAVSCFMNMLLLVSAADYLGVIEFSVLILTGLVIYVIMVMTQWTGRDDVSVSQPCLSRERRNLLAHQDSDADSEGSL